MDDLLETLSIACMGFMFFSVIFLCAWMYPPLHEAKKVDCALAEFSPDIGAEIKKLCREARSKK
jgi:hypothetical protein